MHKAQDLVTGRHVAVKFEMANHIDGLKKELKIYERLRDAPGLSSWFTKSCVGVPCSEIAPPTLWSGLLALCCSSPSPCVHSSTLRKL